MDKKVILITVICSIVLFAGIFTLCATYGGVQSNVDGKSNEKMVETNYETLTKALDGYYELIENSADESEKSELLQALHDYIVLDFQGEYYYHDDNTNSGSDYMRSNYPERFTDEYDTRTIFITSDGFAYCFPYTRAEAERKGLTAETLEDVENIYRYKIKEIATSDADGAYLMHKSAKMVLVSQYVSDCYETADSVFEEIEIEFYTDHSSYTMTGYFSDMITERDDVSRWVSNLSSGMSYYREYFRDAENAEAYNAKEVAKDLEDQEKMEEQKENEKKLAQSIPKVGMTASEVKKTKWGEPDKINKDTYEWGTTEQWVYRRYGYVYLENGVVTSVSER